MNERKSVSGDRGLDPGIAMDSKFQSAVSYVPLKSIQPYRTRDEFLVAMREDLAEWFNGLYHLDMEESTLFQHLSNGVILCQHANAFNEAMKCSRNYETPSRDHFSFSGSTEEVASGPSVPGSGGPVQCHRVAQPGTFHSRVNIANFLSWCRGTVGLRDTLLFETEDLVQGRNERNVVLCLLEVARRGGRVGMPVPTLVQLEAEIDEEIRLEDTGGHHGSSGVRGTKDVGVQTPADDVELVPGNFFSSSESRQHPVPSRTLRQSSVASSVANRRSKPVIEVDFLSLDEMVRKLLGRCTCEAQYPMVRVSEGKYRIGESLVYIFVRVLRNHVMVRIGGGWDTLENYLHRHDPCRMEVKAPRHGSRQSHCSAHPSHTSSTSSASSSIIADSAAEEWEDSDGIFQQDESGSLTGHHHHHQPRHCSVDRTGELVAAVQSKTGRRRAFSSAPEGHQEEDPGPADMGGARVASSGGKTVADAACQATAVDLIRSYSSSSSGTASLDPTTDRFETHGHKVQTQANETCHPSVNTDRRTLNNMGAISDATEGNNNNTNATTNEALGINVATLQATTTTATAAAATAAANPQKKSSSCQADSVRSNASRLLPRICRICEKPFSAAKENRTNELCPTCSRQNDSHRPSNKTSEIPRPKKSLPARPGSTPDRRCSSTKEKSHRNHPSGAAAITLDVCREFAAAGPVNQPDTPSAYFVQLERQSKLRRPASVVENRPQNVNNNPCVLHHPPPSNALPRNTRPAAPTPGRSHRLLRPSSAVEKRGHAGGAHRQGDPPRAEGSRRTLPALISPPETHFIRSNSVQKKSTRNEDFIKEDDNRRKPEAAIMGIGRNSLITKQPNVLLSPQNSYSPQVTEISEGMQEAPNDEGESVTKTRIRKDMHKNSSTLTKIPMPSRITLH